MKKINFTIVLVLFIFFVAQSQIATTLNLMPVPQKIELGNGKLLLTQNFSAAIHESSPDTILIKGVNRMMQTLNRRSALYFTHKYITSNDKSDTAILQVSVNKSVTPDIGIDESYSLSIDENKMILNAPTTLGALHGFQTILQLLTKTNDGGFYFPAVKIKDVPRFSWRGLMMDPARHFLPVDDIKRNIDAMAAVKMNVLHFHLSDNEGFRIESKIYPQLQNKGSNGEYYTQAQIKDIIAYAEERGIIVVPEFDMPGHTKSWFAGYPELGSSSNTNDSILSFFKNMKKMDLATIMKYVQTVPTPAMNPAKESTYQFIDKFMGEMVSLFPSKYIHIGADENNGVAWKNNPSIVAFMKARKIPDTHALQAYFVSRVQKIVEKHNKQMIAWEEAFSKDISKNVTLQIWQNNAYLKKAVDNGNNALLSKGFYLDVFYPAYIYYNNPDLPKTLNDTLASKLQGGEAAQWTELADKTNIETRIWPRAAAVAERLWSPASVDNADDLYRRLFIVSKELDEQGLQHIADYERNVRSLSNNSDYDAVKTLTDVLTPIKGYKKLFAQLGTNPQSLVYPPDPLVQVSDIVFVDSRVKWKFREAVKSYLENKEEDSKEIILHYLNQWKDNDALLTKAFESSPRLKAVEQHSKDLSAIATIGLNAMKDIESGISPDQSQVSQNLAMLKQADKAYGETELSVIPEIESLIQQKLIPLPASYPLF